jgi:hypothetical protein
MALRGNACASAFPGIISPQKCVRVNIPIYADLGTEVKNGANMGPAEVVKRCKSTSPGTALKGRYIGRTTVD